MEGFADMTRSTIGLVGSFLFATLLATGCGGSSSPEAAHRATTTTAKTYVRLVAEGVVVSPSTGLHDGQGVTVSVKGFEPTRKFYLSECDEPTQVNRLGCGAQLAAQPFGLTRP